MHIPRGLLILDEVCVSADILFHGMFRHSRTSCSDV